MDTVSIKSKERVKNLGEVFTPDNIVQEMISLISDIEWDKTVLEPTCGTGNFIVCIIDKKLEIGMTPLDALNTTWGLDICKDNIKETRDRVLKKIYNKLSHKEFKSAVCIIHYNIFQVSDTLEILEKLIDLPFYENSKKKYNTKGIKKILDFDFESAFGNNIFKIKKFKDQNFWDVRKK